MPKDNTRPRRVAEQIQRELAELIRLEVKDPRVGMVTLTGVDVTPDYAHAKVYFTLLGGSEQAAAVSAGLERAAGFLRSQLAQRIKLRVTPLLHFVHDSSVENGSHLSQLIDAAIAEDRGHPSE
ncbi:MAG: 30S ribosome-binding factor RbfA [Sulfuricella sp.]|nr:30S ribosome-binding factor RbfA [Sulfuricella sp.]